MYLRNVLPLNKIKIPVNEMSFRQPCKISSRFANPASFRRLKAWVSSKNIFKTSLRCLFADWESLIKRFWQLNFLKAHSLRQFLAAESPLKMMKNAFYFMSKVSFVLKIFSFLSWLFGHLAKRLDKKWRLILNFMTS